MLKADNNNGSRSTVRVHSVPGGWQLDCRTNDLALMFRSGAMAERNAHRLAECIADCGEDAKVVIEDRAHAVIGTTSYWATE